VKNVLCVLQISTKNSPKKLTMSVVNVIFPAPNATLKLNIVQDIFDNLLEFFGQFLNVFFFSKCKNKLEKNSQSFNNVVGI
jgi:hypothetical protein